MRVVEVRARIEPELADRSTSAARSSVPAEAARESRRWPTDGSVSEARQALIAWAAAARTSGSGSDSAATAAASTVGATSRQPATARA